MQFSNYVFIYDGSDDCIICSYTVTVQPEPRVCDPLDPNWLLKFYSQWADMRLLSSHVTLIKDADNTVS